MTDLKKLIREGNIILGTDVVLKRLKKGEISTVFVAKNCPAEVLVQLEHYHKVSTFELEKTELTNKELGVLCKKPFSIVLIGVPKA